MSAENPAQTAAAPATRRKMPPEFSILLVLLGITLAFEALGWIFVGQSFLGNWQRLQIIILQMSVVGIIAVGVTQVIITGGIDLSVGSVYALGGSSRHTGRTAGSLQGCSCPSSCAASSVCSTASSSPDWAFRR